MKNKNTFIIGLSTLLMFCQLTQKVFGQRTYANAQPKTNVQKLTAAVAANPGDMKAHEAFISAFDIDDPLLLKQYTIWMKRFPGSAAVPFALGKAYSEYDNHRNVAKTYLLKAINIDSGLADAWACLSSTADFFNEHQAAFEYIGKATQLDPKNAEYAYKYAGFFKDSDQTKYDSLMLNVAYRFPGDKRAAMALYYLASDSFNANEKTAYYEALYKMFSKEQSEWFRAGMRDYYNYLLNTAPDKAFDLALRMVLEIKINRGLWKQKLLVARQFIEADKLLAENRPGDAMAMLNRVDLQNSKINGLLIDAEEALALFKARAADAGNKTLDAYDSLKMYYSRQPSDKLHKVMINYAAKLGIDSNKVDTDVWKVRNAMAWKQTDFTLQNSVDHKKVSLSDYRGKVVLLTYWFPSCGPCRSEFPHFEAVLKKINNPDVAYMAINLFNQDESSIMPIIKNSGYTFIPLRNDPNKDKGNIPNTFSTPTNFLIDQNGRVIFSDFLINDKNERTLELMISELLKMGDSDNKVLYASKPLTAN